MINSNDIDRDHTPVNFGKYRGQTPDEISEHDPSYVRWMYTNISPRPCSTWLYQQCVNDYSRSSSEDIREVWGDE